MTSTMRSLILGLTGLALSGFSAAQSQSATEVVTVYWMVHSGIMPTEDLEEAYATVTWTGSVVTAEPEATTYSLAMPPLTNLGLDYVQTDFTLVNGPSTHAAWQVYNLSTTYGEFCSMSAISPSSSPPAFPYTADPAELDYDCTIISLGSRVDGTGEDRSTAAVVETHTNSFPFETSSLLFGEGVTRTFVGVQAVITEGAEMLESDGEEGDRDRFGRTESGEAVDSYGRTRVGGEETESVGGSATGAVASETAEGDAAETSASTQESGVAGRTAVSLMLLGAGLVGAGLFV